MYTFKFKYVYIKIHIIITTIMYTYEKKLIEEKRILDIM